MQIDTLRFGTITIEDHNLVVFDDGLPGLEDYREFIVLQYDESYPISWLQSVTDGSICLPVVESFDLMPDYVFDIPEDDVQDLNLKKPEDLHVISVVVIPEKVEDMTLNLAAPIIINATTGKAKQIILSGGDFNVRFPVFQLICDMLRGEEEANAGSLKEA